MTITAQDITKLRQTTGAGMMDCKKSLIEANGNFDEAIKLLRKKGQKIAAARVDRKTAEGLIVGGTSKAGTQGILIALGSETDFVAKNENFRQLANQIFDIALEKCPKTLDELKKLSIDSLTVEEKIVGLIAKMGENIGLTAYEILTGDVVTSYVHTGDKLGVLVALQGPTGELTQAVGKDIALQVAALHPIAIDKEDIPTTVIDQESEAAREQSKAEAKTPAILEKIVQNKLNNFFREHTLLNQLFIKDNAITVGQYLSKAAPGAKVTAFKRIAVGA
jgi:elongation factor Ts